MPDALPASAVSNQIRLWKQKRRGRNFLLPIPHPGLRIAYTEDKQLSQPTPSGIIWCMLPTFAWKADKHRDIIHPTWTLRCGIFSVLSELRSLDVEDCVFENVLLKSGFCAIAVWPCNCRLRGTPRPYMEAMTPFHRCLNPTCHG